MKRNRPKKKKQNSFLTGALVSFILFLMSPLLAYCSGGGEPAEIVIPRDKVPQVQGIVSIEKNDQKFPAVNWEVTLYSEELKRSAPVYSGSDGVYILRNIPPGKNTLIKRGYFFLTSM